MNIIQSSEKNHHCKYIDTDTLNTIFMQNGIKSAYLDQFILNNEFMHHYRPGIIDVFKLCLLAILYSNESNDDKFASLSFIMRMEVKRRNKTMMRPQDYEAYVR